MCDHKTIAETNNFIVLDKYTKIEQQGGGWIVNTFLYNFYSVIFVRRYSTGVMYSKVL